MNTIKKSLVRYQDLRAIPVRDTNEQVIALDEIGVVNGYWKTKQDMQPFFKGKILVRVSVGQKLKRADLYLKKYSTNWSLYVTYGYRSLKIQTQSFTRVLREQINKSFIPDPITLYELIHKKIAVPTVAGHPTGGAVDIFIMNTETKKPLDFGSEIYDYTTSAYPTFTKGISKKAKQNRILLRRVMMNVEFAPYDGEWWHFSYGDREWAYYYGKKNALYKQLSIPEVTKQITCLNK